MTLPKRTKRKKEKDWLETDDREICIGIIVDDKLCQWAEQNFSLSLFESRTAQTVANWVYDYYRKYKKAPNRNIVKIVEDQEKYGKLPPDIMDELKEEILPRLNEQYEKDLDFNPEYLLNRAKDEAYRRQLTERNEEASLLIQQNELTEAGKLLKIDELGIPNKLNKFILGMKEMKAHNKKEPRLLMKPWLREGQVTFIYGEAGVGKSLLSTNIAYLLGLKDHDGIEHEIGEWQVKSNTGCLYVDGELGEVELRERISQFEWLGEQREDIRIKVFPLPEYQLETEDTFYLSERKNQLQLIQWLKENPLYKVIILDSVTTLFGLMEESSNSEWSLKINPFLRDLRALGVATIILHHSGKDIKRGLRGASGMSAMVHNTFRLTNHSDKDIDEGEAWFTLTKDKQRSASFSFRKFGIHYFQNSKFTTTEWEITEGGTGKEDKLDTNQIKIIKHLLRGRFTQNEIAERMDCTQANVSQVKSRAIKLNYLYPDGKQTQLWTDLMEQNINDRNDD